MFSRHSSPQMSSANLLSSKNLRQTNALLTHKFEINTTKKAQTIDNMITIAINVSLAFLLLSHYTQTVIAFSPQSMNNKKTKQYASASSTIAYPPPSTVEPSSPSFNDRMRGMLLDNGKKNTAAKTLQQEQRRGPSNVQEVATLQQFKEVVGEESDKIVAVRFYAPWCRACKKAKPYFYKMANEFPNVKFVEVPVTPENKKNLIAGLGVPSLPYGHIYDPTLGKVEESRLNKQQISTVARKIQSYVQGSCKLEAVGDASNPYGPKVVSL